MELVAAKTRRDAWSEDASRLRLMQAILGDFSAINVKGNVRFYLTLSDNMLFCTSWRVCCGKPAVAKPAVQTLL